MKTNIVFALVHIFKQFSETVLLKEEIALSQRLFFLKLRYFASPNLFLLQRHFNTASKKRTILHGVLQTLARPFWITFSSLWNAHPRCLCFAAPLLPQPWFILGKSSKEPSLPMADRPVSSVSLHQHGNLNVFVSFPRAALRQVSSL